MTKLMFALLSAQAVVPVALGLEFQGLHFNTVDEVVAFANDIGTKSSVEEQAVLKTLLNERGQWHPEATSLFKDVVNRPSSRRLANLGSRKACNAATEETCKLMVDDQCTTCRWNFGTCKKNECDDYGSEADCCSNPNKVATGCVYSKATSQCMGKTCENAWRFGGSSDRSDGSAMNAACKAQPGCTSVCDSEMAAKAKEDTFSQKHGFCSPGSEGDYICDTAMGTGPKRVKNVPTEMSAADAMKALTSAMGSSSCNIMACSTCLKLSDCAQMKTAVAAGGKCNDKCNALAQTDAETECLFCGQKAAGCTPEQATPFSSCDTVALTDVPKGAAALQCDGVCAAAKSSCPNTDATEMNCFEAVTGGAAGLTAAMVAWLSPVLACLLVVNLMM